MTTNLRGGSNKSTWVNTGLSSGVKSVCIVASD